jgi:hypothetical protein
MNQRPLFDVVESYSYTQYEKQSTIAAINKDLAPANDNVLLLPPTVQANLTNVDLPSSDTGVSSDESSSAKVTIVGYGSKADKREAHLANVDFAAAEVAPVTALGLLTQRTANGNAVEKTNLIAAVKEVTAKLAEQNIMSNVVAFGQQLFGTVESEVKSEKLSDVKAEQLKKTVVESVQEAAKAQVQAAAPESGKAEIVAEEAASNVEAKIEAKPEILASKEETKQVVEQCVTEACRQNTNMSETKVQAVAQDVVTATMDKVDAKMTQEKVAASVILKQPDVAAKTTAAAEAIKSVIEEKSTVEVQPESGKVIIQSENDNAVIATINHMAEQLIKPAVEESAKNLVEVKRNEQSIGDGQHQVSLEVEAPTKLLKSVQEEISNKVTKEVIEGFMSRLPERFTNGKKKSYVRPSNVTLLGQNGRKINIASSIHHNMLEAFEQASQTLIDTHSSSEVKAVVEAAGATDIKQNNIVTADANIQKKENGTQNVNVTVCAECEANKSKVLTNSVASLVASKLLDKNVSAVDVKSEPGPRPNTTKLNIVATVPLEESGNEVAETVVKSVNDASVVISTGSARRKSSGNDSLLNIIMFALIAYIVYQLMSRGR